MNAYSNPILCGFYPDPSICRVDEDYYLVTSTFAYFPGIPVFHSRDLVHWKIVGHVLNRTTQVDFNGLGISKGVFAPSIRYHDKKFYVTCTLVDGGGNFVVTADDPSGPWSDPVWLAVEGIDPSLYFEDEMTWLVYNSDAPGNRPAYDGHRTIRMISFDRKKLSVSSEEFILVDGGSEPARQPRWIEGPHVLKRNGWYYLIAAEGGTGYDHSVVAFRSKDIHGPYHSCPDNPVLKHHPDMQFPVTSTGHADLVDTPSGTWHAVFLGCRPYEGDHYNTGRETFLVPVQWKSDWPVLNKGYEKIAVHYPVPHAHGEKSQYPYSGNFRVYDQFDTPFPGNDWLFLRTPKEKWYHAEREKLVMQLRPETCSGFGNPAFLARRQQHRCCQASCGLEFEARKENEKAGLAVYQDQNHFYFICLSLAERGAAVEVYKSTLMPRDGCRMQLLSSAPLPARKKIGLRIVADNKFYSFYYSTNKDEWILLFDKADAKFLSTHTAGGFVGCTFALYATSLGVESDNMAIFRWFEYVGNDVVFNL